MLLLGAGPRALLLQIAHPLVAAGVADHSDFRADPWRRLQGTLRSFLRIVYGSTPLARAEIRRLHDLHLTISGPGYAATDPDLSLWVHATLIDSTLVAYEHWLAPLPHERRAAFYAETRPIGRAFGVPDEMLPRDIDAFETYLAEQIGPGGPVQVGDLARELAEVILRPPLPGPLGRLPVPTAAYEWSLWPAIGLLPPHVREAYRFPWEWPQRAVSAWLVAGWRTWRPILPETFRQMPQALAADQRVGIDPVG
jgi:uncharacterized protein (DUF2236 family)